MFTNCLRHSIIRQQCLSIRIFARSIVSNSPTITKISLGDLPKTGKKVPEVLEISPKRLKYLESLPTSMRGIRETMDKYPDYVVLTQVGSFYEMYFETAQKFGDILNLKVAKKTFKNVEVAMSGFPLYRIDQHLITLVTKLNQGVVVVDQFRDDEESDNVRRRVAKIISPGTLIDEEFLNEQYYNFLLSVEFPDNIFSRSANPETLIGLSWVDISVGCLYVQEVTLKELASAITRISPIEILLDQNVAGIDFSGWYQELTELSNHSNVKFRDSSRIYKTLDSFYNMFNFPKLALKTRFNELSTKEASALRNLLRYVDDHFPEMVVHLQLPEKKFSSNILQIDSRTAEALELHKTARDQFVRGSLLSSVKRTVTHSGSRLLSQWIAAPSTNISEIKQRQAVVAIFFDNSAFTKFITSHLKECHDIGRIVQRLSMARGNILDLVHLAATVSKYEDLKDHILKEGENNEISKLKEIIQLPDSQVDLVELISNDIDVDALLSDLQSQQDELKAELDPKFHSTEKEPKDLQTNEDYVIRENASPVLKYLHEELRGYYQEKKDMEAAVTLLLDEGNFKEIQLKVTNRNTYEVYVRGTRNSNYELLSKVLTGSTIVSKHTYTRWINYPDWSTLGRNIELIRSRIQREEAIVIKQLQKKVIERSLPLRKIGSFLDFVDVTSSFAVLAKEKNLVAPEVNTTTELTIVNGRHLVVEDSLKKDLKNFVANDLLMNKDNRLWIITGPNMGGKSTFLRQNAIIIILAQMGSYVPASSATIGIVDKLFSRVNSSDDLYNNLSTFMVEMVETSYILNGATDRSLAVLDEIGRGTTPAEGVSVAYATLKHLSEVNKSRVLFSTHYGKTIEKLMNAKQDESYVFKKVQVIEKSKNLKFTHKLVEGVADKAYAIHVAKKAGFPISALEDAQKTLDQLKD